MYVCMDTDDINYTINTLSLCMHACMYVLYVCMHVCMYVWLFIYTHCMYIRMYVCIYSLILLLSDLRICYMVICMYVCMCGLHLARVCLTVGESDRGSLGRIPECILHHPAAPSAAKRRPKPIVPGEADGLQQAAALPRAPGRHSSCR